MQHSVKALVKEPAVSDGRIQPGDKLIAANGVQLANFSHAELIAFLRKCPDEVELKVHFSRSRDIINSGLSVRLRRVTYRNSEKILPELD